jgi:hypothetical protein
VYEGRTLSQLMAMSVEWSVRTQPPSGLSVISWAGGGGL